MLTIARRDVEDTVEPISIEGKPFWKVSLRRYNFKPLIVPEIRMPDPSTGVTKIFKDDGSQLEHTKRRMK